MNRFFSFLLALLLGVAACLPAMLAVAAGVLAAAWLLN